AAMHHDHVQRPLVQVGGWSLSFSQAASSAGSALVANVAAGSANTPSLITTTSISPTRSAQRDGTSSSGPGLPGCEVFSKLMLVSLLLTALPTRVPLIGC